jgi:hypothetical protein
MFNATTFEGNKRKQQINSTKQRNKNLRTKQISHR